MFMLGTLPGMVRVDWSLDLSSSANRGAKVTETLDGGSYAQLSPHTSREWSMSASYVRTQDVAALEHVINSAGVAALVLVTERAFSTNGLTPRQAAFGAGTLPSGVSRSGMEWVTDQFGTWQAPYTAGTTLTGQWVLDVDGPPAPVVPSAPVTVAAGLRSASPTVAPRLGVDWVRATGTVISRQMADAQAITQSQPLARAHATFTAPADAVAARLVFQGASQVAAPTLSLLSRLTPWDMGDGAPSVVVSGGRGIGMARAASPQLYSSYDLTLREVGRAHW